MHTGIDDLQRQNLGDVGNAGNALPGELTVGPALGVLEPRSAACRDEFPS